MHFDGHNGQRTLPCTPKLAPHQRVRGRTAKVYKLVLKEMAVIEHFGNIPNIPQKDQGNARHIR